jgi:hypothetical protein
MDKVASILAKLQNKARETGRSFQLCLQLFCQEEFLRKVALSKYADNLILKGGLFIYTLTNFEGRKLQEAIFETLQKRGTAYEKDSLQNIVNFAYNEAMNVKWQYFLKKLKLSEPELVTVIKLLETFLTPIYRAIISENEFFGNWNGEKREWS